MGVINISGSCRDGEFHNGEVILNKILVDVRDICTAINQHLGVDDFY